MKKTIICLLSLLIMLSLFGCSVRHPYEFWGEEDKIEKIEIIKCRYYIFDEVITGFDYDIICRVDDTQAFLYDFSKLTCYLVLYDPRSAFRENHEDVAIKMTYTDGSYEVINPYGQSTFDSHDNSYDAYYGIYSFDNEEFNSLIDKYQMSNN
ncbi:MAG: hypothetical protein IJF38_03295 [Clostridia bacterium]|nr:hypothetical protein [Clostridia bacterium]